MRGFSIGKPHFCAPLLEIQWNRIQDSSRTLQPDVQLETYVGRGEEQVLRAQGSYGGDSELFREDFELSAILVRGFSTATASFLRTFAANLN